MMKNEHNILDHFLQEKVDQAQFQLKDEYWNKMEAMLDEEDKKKKRPFIFWRGLSIFIGLLLLSLGAYMFPKLNAKKGSTPKTEQALKLSSVELPSANQDLPNAETNSESNTNNEAIQSQNEAIQSDENAQTSNHDIAKVDNATNTTQANYSSANTKVNSNATTQIDQQGISHMPINSNKKRAKKNHAIRNTNQAVDNQSTSVNVNDVNIDNTQGVQPVASQKAIPQKNAFAKKDVNNLVSKKVKVKKDKVDMANALPNQSTLVSNQQQILNNSVADIDHSPSQTKSTDINNQQVVNLHGKNMLAKDTVILKGRAAIDAAISNPRYNASLKDYVPEYIEDITILSYKPIQKNAETNVETALPKPTEMSEAKPFEAKPFELFMLAGMSANKAFKGNVSSPVSWAFSPYVGVGFDKPLTERITLSSHVGFTYFNGLNLSEKSSVVNYSFGVDSSNTILTHKKMFQTYLPISLYYQVLRNHYIMAAIGASYSMDVASSMQLNNGTSSAKTGYRSGFNQFDAFAGLGYSYQIFNRVMVQIAFQQGFMNMTKADYFQQANTTNKQMRFQVGIKYNFKRNDN